MSASAAQNRRRPRTRFWRALAVILALPTASSAEIDAIEYFWDDNDPGAGNGTSLDLGCAVRHSCADSPPGPQDFTLLELPAGCDEVDTSDLTPGLHRLYFRAHESSGAWGWGPLYAVPVDIPRPDCWEILEAEWFTDRDPAPNGREAPPAGSGHPLPQQALVTDTATWLAESPQWATLDLAALLDPGVHSIGFRVKEGPPVVGVGCPPSDGIWSPVQWVDVIVGRPEAAAKVCLVHESGVYDPADPHSVCDVPRPPSAEVCLERQELQPPDGRWFGGEVSCTDFLGGPASVRVTGETGDIRLERLEEVELPRCADDPFRRGDCNQDGAADISDVICVLSYLFVTGTCRGQQCSCLDANDANDDARIDITDPMMLLEWMFGSHLPPPLPGAAACGADLTADELGPCRYDEVLCPD